MGGRKSTSLFLLVQVAMGRFKALQSTQKAKGGFTPALLVNFA